MRLHVPLLLALGGLLACPQRSTEAPEDTDEGGGEREGETLDGDPRVDPQRCTGDSLDIEELIKVGACTIPTDRARPLPDEDRLVIEVPQRLKVAPGKPLEFDLVLRNVGREPLDLDLVFRQLLPLAPESTIWIGEGEPEGARPDPSCTLHAISTEPPPERITLPAGAELPVPCEWHANTRLVDPSSYVGSECPDFAELGKGDWRSVFRIAGRSVTVDIKVK
ncbi:hypothetical protein ACNOYE_26185 [Nannocystaceae bacterium ST9]